MVSHGSPSPAVGLWPHSPPRRPATSGRSLSSFSSSFSRPPAWQSSLPQPWRWPLSWIASLLSPLYNVPALRHWMPQVISSSRHRPPSRCPHLLPQTNSISNSLAVQLLEAGSPSISTSDVVLHRLEDVLDTSTTFRELAKT